MSESIFDLKEEIEKSAVDAVEFAKEHVNMDLDFSEESIIRIEKICKVLYEQKPKGFLAKLFRSGPSDRKIWEFAMTLGSYVGEVFRREFGGEWKKNSQLAEGMLILDINGHEIYPQMKVFKRLKNGDEDNIWHYYKIIKMKLGSEDQFSVVKMNLKK